jgi:hypothetical protein
MAVGGSTCGAKLGGAKKNNKKYGGNANPESDYKNNDESMEYSVSSGNNESVMGGRKRPVKRVAKPVAKRVVKPVVKRVVKRVVRRGGNDGMPQIYDEEMPHIEQTKGVGEMPTTEKLTMDGGRKKYAKRGGNASDMPQSLGGAKKRVLTPYNKFVKKHFPAMKVKYPDYKAPQIMKKIADEWKKTK